jgi:hypothetical protein
MDTPPKDMSLSDLYPQLTEEQLQEAEENLEEYLKDTLSVFERIRNDPREYARFKALTAAYRDVMMKKEKPDPSAS